MSFNLHGSLRLVMISVLIPFQILMSATPEEIAERQRIGNLKFTDVPFAKFSDQNISECGAIAFKFQEKQWKHSESDHFIIHYQIAEIRDRLAQEAEFYYWKMKNDFKLTNDLVDHKSHIFIFEDEARWRQFQANANILGIAGVCIKNEFFCYYPKKKDKHYSGVLAHEMTHLVFNRFFEGTPPIWLNEGFAEYQMRRAYFSLYDNRFEEIDKNASKVLQVDFLEMVNLHSYPTDRAQNGALYIKSQLAVEVLIEKGGIERFTSFTKTMILNPAFQAAFEKHYLNVLNMNQFLKELERKEKLIKNRRV